MCFSAEVSFGASAVITTVGVAAFKKSNNKEQRLFALIPILFGIQQFFEGCLWLTLESESYQYLVSLFTFGFLIFAQLIWPVWVPLSVFVMEKRKLRKRLIGFSLATGIALFIVLAYRMVFYEVTAQIENHHIFYTVGHFKSTNWWSGILYLLPAVFPFVFSSNKFVNYLGLMMLLLFVVAKVFYLKYMISTWCLFAAVLSLYIYFILKKE
ncbi:DUF6629 family protein [Carboxylicivirga marina]|uniref:Uncharacterized protein n=1 Tax=Carboxylicivirga marina TaxID=2800988 RepID=A0ABS1HKX1_9BACT|nr:DUF6629 family protein [Carboxylicivirga marina]MBK3518324.1 hypothetical protein [Carboxylicivirga marina]